MQEIWLPERNLDELDTIHQEYMSVGVSGMTSTEILHGRPYGGVGIIWKKSIAHMVKPVKCNSNRVCCVKLMLPDNFNILLINCYMPCDNYKQHEVDIAFQQAVDDIEEVVIKNDDVVSIILAGDINVDRMHIQNLCGTFVRHNS